MITYNWINSFLYDRHHCIVINNAVSSYIKTNSGIVQGSGLGLFLFAVAACDLKPRNDNVKYYKYADDTFLIIPGTDSNVFKQEISHIKSWSTMNNLVINTDKTKSICFTMPWRAKQLSIFSNNPDILSMNVVGCMDILGISFRGDMNMVNHISNLVKKSNKLFYTLRILRAHSLELKSARDVFNSTIISRIMYCISG